MIATADQIAAQDRADLAELDAHLEQRTLKLWLLELETHIFNTWGLYQVLTTDERYLRENAPHNTAWLHQQGTMLRGRVQMIQDQLRQIGGTFAQKIVPGKKGKELRIHVNQLAKSRKDFDKLTAKILSMALLDDVKKNHDEGGKYMWHLSKWDSHAICQVSVYLLDCLMTEQQYIRLCLKWIDTQAKEAAKEKKGKA